MKYSNKKISNGDKVISMNNFREVTINNINKRNFDIKYSFYKFYYNLNFLDHNPNLKIIRLHLISNNQLLLLLVAFKEALKEK